MLLQPLQYLGVTINNGVIVGSLSRELLLQLLIQVNLDMALLLVLPQLLLILINPGYAITSGIATTATNISTVAASTNATHYLLFSPVNGGSGVAVSL